MRNITPKYATKQDFPALIFSHPTRGIYFLLGVHNYKKIKGLDSGKIKSLPNSEKRDQLTCVISVIAENKRHACHEIHLHTMRAVAIRIRFSRSPLGTLRSIVSELVPTDKEKNETPAFLESRSAKASSTN